MNPNYTNLNENVKLKQEQSERHLNNNKEMSKRAGSSRRYNKLAKEAGISAQQRHAAYNRINAATRRRLDQQAEQVSDDEFQDAIGPMETHGGMIVTH